MKRTHRGGTMDEPMPAELPHLTVPDAGAWRA
jgi:hypothetical protein